MPFIHQMSDYRKIIPVTDYMQQVQKLGKKSIMKIIHANTAAKIVEKQTPVWLGTGLEPSPQSQSSSLGDA